MVSAKQSGGRKIGKSSIALRKSSRGTAYHAKLVERAKGWHLQVNVAVGADTAALQQLGFEQGSQLFVAVLLALENNGLIDLDHPSKNSSVKLYDPFGILSGKKPIPWQLKNPAAEGCVECHTVCVKDPVAGYNCYEACACVPCP